MIIDGRAIARDLLEEIRINIPEGTTPIVRAIAISPTPATQSYLRIKARAAEAAGMKLEVTEFPSDVTTETVIDAISHDPSNALIVQLPLPAHLHEQAILAAIPLQKDADVLSEEARDRFMREEVGAHIPPVAAAVETILARAGVAVEGASIVVVGKGFLVGEPVAAHLTALGGKVTAYDKDSFTADVLQSADIVVSGAGVPHLITSEMLKPGVVLIDAGTSDQGGAIVGDIDPRCAEIASVYTPVPGGVGPVAVACLFKNVSI